MISVVEQVQAHRANRRNEALAAYRETVRAIGSDQQVDYGHLSAVMLAAGKTDAHLASDLETFARRKISAGKLADVPAIRAEAAKVSAKLDHIAETLAQAKRSHDAAAQILGQQLSDLQAQLASAESARDDLVRSSDDPTILAREKELSAEIKKLEGERNRIESELGVQRQGSPGNQRHTITMQIERAEAQGDKRKTESLRKQLAEVDRLAIKPMQDRLAAIAARRAEIQLEQAKLDAQKLKP